MSDNLPAIRDEDIEVELILRQVLQDQRSRKAASATGLGRFSR